MHRLSFSIIFRSIEKPPEPAPVPEVPKDPATAPIGVNKETLIELHAQNKPLGIVVVKGDSSTVQVIIFHFTVILKSDKNNVIF